ncbi:MAG: S-ribosylhomocysteine lyase [Spirochaetaceae bacterium]|jgi:S-ribosylhomocysteine lyase|nr:S-ribosylhomocysteine lyase [Spirochaetaceae bacterium]
MEKIASFQMDHTKLLAGLYVSRTDKFGDTCITTMDMRFKMPNREPVMDMPVMHTLEHLCATFLRSHKVWSQKIIYFGPMGCRTGCYALFEGERTSAELLPLMIEMFEWLVKFEGEIPGAQPGECGNYLEHNLNMAKFEASKYLNVLKNAKPENLNYPVSTQLKSSYTY